MVRIETPQANAVGLASKFKHAMRTVCLAFALGIGLAGSVAAQVSADTLIQLQRTSCLGSCPIYTVTIDASGTVTYDGQEHVRVIGRATARIPTQRVARLLATAERIHFFDLDDAYREIHNPDGTIRSVTDFPTKFVTITANGLTKRVEDYFGAPDALADFEREIDQVAGTVRWIFLDRPTLDELRASGWSATGEEGARLLRQAIGRDEVEIAQTLIEMGADVNGPPENRLPPLMLARSVAMVELLVQTGADPNERPVGRVAARTPLMSTDYKDAGVAEALLKAGARVEDLDDGRSALFYAACVGNWRVVTVLLRAGANPRGSASITAAQCARQARQHELNQARQDDLNRRRTALDRGRPTVEDFDRVIALLDEAEQRIRR
jgi:Domain of unknown function (DUF6438)/Ankyrin repeat